MDARRLPRLGSRLAWAGVRRATTEATWLTTRRGGVDLAVFHEFEPAPAGGGHQFLRALVREFARRGLAVEVNRISRGTPACLFNSFNFDFARLRRFARDDCRMVHRVDGPVGVYRGFDDGTDSRVAAINAELAHATVLQSRYSLAKHREIGISLRDPVVISNAVDPEIFHRAERQKPQHGLPLRVIASSWSKNPRKGADVLAWLDRNLDTSLSTVTFVGQLPQSFDRIQRVGALDSNGVARLLREHDAYLAASRDDPCSNALLEALACGLPAAYLASGGHPELVGEAGVPFETPEDVPDALLQLASDLDGYRSRIRVPSLAAVADAYLRVLGLGGETSP